MAALKKLRKSRKAVVEGASAASAASTTTGLSGTRRPLSTLYVSIRPPITARPCGSSVPITTTNPATFHRLIFAVNHEDASFLWSRLRSSPALPLRPAALDSACVNESV